MKKMLIFFWVTHSSEVLSLLCLEVVGGGKPVLPDSWVLVLAKPLVSGIGESTHCFSTIKQG